MYLANLHVQVQGMEKGLTLMLVPIHVYFWATFNSGYLNLFLSTRRDSIIFSYEIFILLYVQEQVFW